MAKKKERKEFRREEDIVLATIRIRAEEAADNLKIIRRRLEYLGVNAEILRTIDEQVGKLLAHRLRTKKGQKR